MSHAIYQTKALILSSRNMKEANKLVILYTEDFGLIYTSAQSIREGRSKMKSHLTTLSLVDVDVVRGRELWKLTGIHERQASLTIASTPWYPFLEKVAAVIIRLCPGEEPNHELWNELEHLYLILKENVDYEDIFEIILMSRILFHLGYWSGDELSVTTRTPYDAQSREYAEKHKKALIKKINQALLDSQL